MKAVGTNGVGEPRFPVAEIPPGCIVRFGIDDDMTALVIANFPTTNGPQNGNKPCRLIVYYGCFCDYPGSWEDGRLFQQEHLLNEDLTVIMVPEYS